MNATVSWGASADVARVSQAGFVGVVISYVTPMRSGVNAASAPILHLVPPGHGDMIVREGIPQSPAEVRMLRLPSPPVLLGDSLSRRDLLRTGALGMAGLTL